MLNYYRLEKNEKCKQFFFENSGYFNFWDEYLLLRDKRCNYKNIVGVVLVNRTNYKFVNKLDKLINKHKNIYQCELKESYQKLKPEEMFIDFPELLERRWLCDEDIFYK